LAQADTLDNPPATGLDRPQSFGENDLLRIWEIDTADIAAACEAALTLSQTYATTEVDYGENDLLRSWEIDTADIAAAREAALTLSQTYTTVEADFGEDDVVRSWEIDADDIAAAREAAQYLAAIVKIALQQDAGGG
jgi:hypothetical protein